MKVFFVNGALEWPPQNGPSIHRYQIVKNLVDLGHEVTTMVPDENPLSRVRPKSHWSVFKELRRTDVIYARTGESINAAIRLGAWPWRMMIPSHVPIIWEFNVSLRLRIATGPNPRTDAEIENTIADYRRAAGRCDGVVSLTELGATECRDLLNISNVHVLQDGSDPELFHPDLPPPDAIEPTDKLRVVWIGSHSNRIHDSKLIQELGEYIDTHELPIELHIIGNTRSLFSETLPDSFVFHGSVSYLELPKYLAAMDVGLALYNIVYDGGSPLKLFDYLASGTVPICSESQPMREVLEGHDIGLIGDWTAMTLADTLMEMSRTPERRAEMAAAGRQRLIDSYSWQAITKQTVDIMQDAREKRRRR